jgi:hypothetical protein
MIIKKEQSKYIVSVYWCMFYLKWAKRSCFSYDNFNLRDYGLGSIDGVHKYIGQSIVIYGVYKHIGQSIVIYLFSHESIMIYFDISKYRILVRHFVKYRSWRLRAGLHMNWSGSTTVVAMKQIWSSRWLDKSWSEFKSEAGLTNSMIFIEIHQNSADSVRTHSKNRMDSLVTNSNFQKIIKLRKIL